MCDFTFQLLQEKQLEFGFGDASLKSFMIMHNPVIVVSQPDFEKWTSKKVFFYFLFTLREIKEVMGQSGQEFS